MKLNVDALAANVLKDFSLPGISVAVVKNKKVVLARGYGLRELGTNLQVDQNTLFGIASNTKAFTGTLLAILVDQGKLAWNDPVIKHLPWFQMHDPFVTREITVRDLLVHNSGFSLGAGDLLHWPRTNYTQREVAERVRFIRPKASFRSRFAYDNILYLVAGQLLEAVTGKTWSECIEKNILAPLKMSRSYSSLETVPKGANIAYPHAVSEGKLQRAEFTIRLNAAPAGGIVSCASDMAKWMLTQLARGAIPGGKRRLFSSAQSHELWSPQIVIPVEEKSFGFMGKLGKTLNAYGLGWSMFDYQGKKIVGHTGGHLGLNSRVMLVPELDLGIALFCNGDSEFGTRTLCFQILDHFLGDTSADWTKLVKAYARHMHKLNSAPIPQRQKKSTPPPLLKDYPGHYQDSWYGEVAVALEKGALTMQFAHTPALLGDLEHLHHDTFHVHWRERQLNADAFVTFHRDHKGAVDSAKMAPESGHVDFSYNFQDLDLRRVGSGTRRSSSK